MFIGGEALGPAVESLVKYATDELYIPILNVAWQNVVEPLLKTPAGQASLQKVFPSTPGLRELLLHGATKAFGNIIFVIYNLGCIPEVPKEASAIDIGVLKGLIAFMVQQRGCHYDVAVTDGFVTPEQVAGVDFCAAAIGAQMTACLKVFDDNITEMPILLKKYAAVTPACAAWNLESVRWMFCGSEDVSLDMKAFGNQCSAFLRCQEKKDAMQLAGNIGGSFHNKALQFAASYDKAKAAIDSGAGVVLCMLLADVFFTPAKFVNAATGLRNSLDYFVVMFPGKEWKECVPAALSSRTITMLGEKVKGAADAGGEAEVKLLKRTASSASMPPPSTTPKKGKVGDKAAPAHA